MRTWIVHHKVWTAVIVVAIVAIAGASAGAGSGSSTPTSVAPGVHSPIIYQRTDKTALGFVVKFRLDRAATCELDTDGETLPNQESPQDRPRGSNSWVVTGGTDASVSCF